MRAYLLENNLPEPGISCEGEPAPDRVVPAILLLLAFNVPDMPKGDLTAEAPADSMGDCAVAAVGEEERPWLVVGKPRVG